MQQTIGQIIGFIALAVLVIVFQKNKRTSMLLLQMLCSFLYAVHYLLLGAATGSIMNLINSFRSYVFSKKEECSWANKSLWLYVFIGIFIISGFITWQGYISLLPVIGMIIGTISFWMNNPRTIRIISLAGPPFWFAYNFLSHSYPGMIGDTFTLISIVIGIIRFDILKKDNELENLCEPESIEA